MKDTQETLEQLSQEIVKAQNKLGEISWAVNRDNLNIENLQKNIKSLQEQETTLKDSVEWLKLKEKSEQVVFDKAYEKNASLLLTQNDEKQKLQAKIIELANFIREKEELLANTEKTVNKGIEIANSRYEKEKKGLEDKRNLVLEENKKVSDINFSLKSETDILEAKKVQHQSSIEEKEKIIASKDDEILSKTNESKKKTVVIEKLDSEIESKQKNIDDLTQEEENKKESIQSLTKENLLLQSEVDGKKEEIGQFTKDKLQLQKDREALKAKEDFIREKFEQAWLKFI